MKVKSHKFELTVKTSKTKLGAEMSVLGAFSIRRPDGCFFQLKRIPNRKKKEIK